MIIDKNDLPKINNDRINQNYEMINKLINDDYIDTLIKEYNLEKYTYIDDLRVFSLLPLRGSIKYINKYTNELRNGGLLIKIYKKNDNKWFGIVKKLSGKKFHFTFDKNYIFYIEHQSKTQKLRESLDIFMNDVNNGKYEIK